MIAPVRRLLDLLYPPKCILCRRLLGRDEADLCGPCRLALPVFDGQLHPGPYCSGAVAALRYEGAVRESLLRYKFGGLSQYAAGYAPLLAAACARLPLAEIDAVTWVPVSRRRRWSRGYDQAQLLARAVARQLDKPLRATLRKARHNRPQSAQETAEARRANVLGAYRALPGVAGGRYLLVDDIVTTGATLSEAARTLLTAGAAAVYGAALAAREQRAAGELTENR